jgi:hypothetical protein
MSDADADLWAEAETVANKTRPLSKISPLTGGIAGLCTVFFAAQVLTAIAGMGRDTDLPWVIAYAIGFGGPFLYLRHAQRNHLAAKTRAYETLQAAAKDTAER